MSELALFPLHTVLFPGGRLPLRIFEARYLDMIGRCLRDGGSFGVCLIRDGAEAGAPATFMSVGTSARIVDWSQLPDGLLGITAVGERRFRVCSSRAQADKLVLGHVDWLAEPAREAVRPEHAWLRELHFRSGDSPGGAEDGVMPSGDDAAELGFRLAERLPLPLAAKQRLLELDAPAERLDKIGEMLRPMLNAGSGNRSR
jgi:hypothetical protein